MNFFIFTQPLSLGDCIAAVLYVCLYLYGGVCVYIYVWVCLCLRVWFCKQASLCVYGKLLPLAVCRGVARQPVASNRKPGPCSALLVPSTGLVSSTSQEGKALQLRLRYSKLNIKVLTVFSYMHMHLFLQLHTSICNWTCLARLSCTYQLQLPQVLIPQQCTGKKA